MEKNFFKITALFVMGLEAREDRHLSWPEMPVSGNQKYLSEPCLAVSTTMESL